jgi:hypothetical protein
MRGHRETLHPTQFRGRPMISTDTGDRILSGTWTSGGRGTASGNYHERRSKNDLRYAWVANQAFLTACCFVECPLDKAMESASSRDHILSSWLVLERSLEAPQASCAWEVVSRLVVVLLPEKEDCSAPHPLRLRPWA